jgi:hypothetical protein
MLRFISGIAVLAVLGALLTVSPAWAQQGWDLYQTTGRGYAGSSDYGNSGWSGSSGWSGGSFYNPAPTWSAPTYGYPFAAFPSAPVVAYPPVYAPPAPVWSAYPISGPTIVQPLSGSSVIYR